jgi:hypothetical protein
MNTEYRYYHFGPFLMGTKVDTDLYNMLCTDITNVVEKEQIDSRSMLAGKIDKEYAFNSDLTQKYTHALMPYASQYLNNLVYNWREADNDPTEEMMREIEKNMHLEGLWVNFQQKNEYNPIHHHIGDISFILYVDVPDVIYQEESSGTGSPNGTITFTYALHPEDLTDRRTPAHRLLKNSLKPLSIVGPLRPTNGDLIMFPSYLYHSVQSFYSDVTRVSVAGNFIMIPSQ